MFARIPTSVASLSCWTCRMGSFSTLTRISDERNAKFPLHCVQAKYEVLRRSDLEDRQRESVRETAELLCVSQNEAARVLRFYKW